MLLAVAMHLNHFPYIQVVVYVWSSLIALIYVFYYQPYESTKQDVVEITNEGLIYLLGIMRISVLALTDEARESLGETLFQVLMIKITFNSIVILMGIFTLFKGCFRKLFVSQVKR